MAHHKSAKKRIRQEERRTVVNGMRVSRIRTYIKRVESAIASGDEKTAAAALKDVQPELMRGASRGVVKRNTASRKLSRLSARVKALKSAA